MNSQIYLIVQLRQKDGFFESYCALRTALWPDCVEECAAEAQQMLDAADLGCIFLALAAENQAVGFIEASLRNVAESATISPVPYIEGWFVKSAHRRQGVGRALVEAVEKWAIARGFSEIASDAQLENTGSIAAHLRLGYQEVERNVCFLKRLGPSPVS